MHLLKADYVEIDKDGHVQESTKGFFRLPGVTTSYLYVGMWGSVFAAHTEDMNLLSINYLHAGAPKYWYSIAPEDAQRFESLACSLFPSHLRTCTEFLRHKSQLISPQYLKKAGIKYKTQVQRAGDIIITFPGSYHFGFNTGFNVAESTNFAVPEWIPWGKKAAVCMCTPHSVRFDVKRLELLLENYTSDMELTREKLAYHEWASLKQMKWNFSRSPPVDANEFPDIDEHTETEPGVKSAEDSSAPFALATINPYVPKADQSFSKTISYENGFFVQVKVGGRSGVNARKRKLPNKENSSEPMEWRRAIRAPGSSLEVGDSVLVLLTCYEDSGERVDRCFSGKLVDSQENFVRVHYDGMAKDMDSWIDISSNTIFLDGGNVSEVEMGISQPVTTAEDTQEEKKVKSKSTEKISPMKGRGNMLKLKAIYKDKPVSVILKIRSSSVSKIAIKQAMKEKSPQKRRKANIFEPNPYAKVYRNNRGSSPDNLNDKTSANLSTSKGESLTRELPKWIRALSVIDVNNMPSYMRPLLRDPTSRKGRGECDSDFKGVNRRVRKGTIRYSAQINHLGHTHYLGTFDNEWEAGSIFAWAYYIIRNHEMGNASVSPCYDHATSMFSQANIPFKCDAQKRTPSSQPIFRECDFLDGQGSFTSEYAYAAIPHFHAYQGYDYSGSEMQYRGSLHHSVPDNNGMRASTPTFSSHENYYRNQHGYYYRTSYYRNHFGHYYHDI